MTSSDGYQGKASVSCNGLLFLLGLLCLMQVPGITQATPPIPALPHPLPGTSNVIASPILSWNLDKWEHIRNGGFESGNALNWTLTSTGPGGFVVHQGNYDPEGPEDPSPPLTGRYSIVSEPMAPGLFALSQEVTLPEGSQPVYLRWSDRIRNYDAGGQFVNSGPDLHTFRVEIQNTNGVVLDIPFRTEQGDTPLAPWQKREVDLTPFRGESIRIVFATYVSLFFFSIHLDRISLTTEAPPDVSTEVYFGTDPSLGATDLLGTTSGTTWTLRELAPATRYYWRLITRLDSDLELSPVWDFTTAPLGEFHHFSWDPLPGSLRVGIPAPVSITARDSYENRITNINIPATLTAESFATSTRERHTLLTNHPGYQGAVLMDRGTVGYSFTVNSGPLLVTSVKSFSGSKVSIWTEQGHRLLAQPVAGPEASWTQTPLENPILLEAGRTYRIGVYGQGLTTHYAAFDQGQDGGSVTLHQSYEGAGDDMPGIAHPARWWLVDLEFEETFLPQPPFPQESITLTNGLYAGFVTLDRTSPAVALHVQSHDPLVSGYSALNAVILNANPPSLPRILSIRHLGHEVILTFEGMAGNSYRLLARDHLLDATWQNLSQIAARPEDGIMVLRDDNPSPRARFYQVVTP